MKRSALLLLCGFALAINSCKKDETPEITTVSTERKSFMLDFTATWCCPCGNAFPIVKEVEHNFPHKLITMALHADDLDPFYNSTMYWHWANIYGVTGIPEMICDNQTVLWGYVLPDLHLDTSHFYEIINSTIVQNVPDCGVGIAKSIEGNTMTVKTKTVFFNETSGKFNLAVYIVEDNLIYDQNCSDDDEHDNVFRASLTDPQGKGKQISQGTVKKGTAFDEEFTFTIPSDYVTENLHVIAVIYEMNNPDPKPVRILNVNRI